MAFQALVVAVAVAMGVVWGSAAIDNAKATHLERPGRSGVSGSEHPPIVHLAMLAPPVDRSLASIHSAGRRHVVKYRASGTEVR
ncbi:hypothetical protein BH23ACT4_BH23ACT4_06500 [soil metagenome]